MDNRAPQQKNKVSACATRTLITEDGVELFVRHYRGHGSAANRTLLVVHGVCEHGGRYEHVAATAAGQGWDTIVADLRGHGHSSGPRAHVGRFTDYIEDVELIRTTYDLDPAQTALLGHSMGGLVAIRYAQQFSERLAALVLCAPFLRAAKPPHAVTTAVGRLLSFIAPRTRFATKIQPEELTRDIEMIQRRSNDPLVTDSVTAGWFFEASYAIRKAWKKAQRMDLPLLVMQGALDNVVDPLATQRWAESVGGTDKTFELFPEHVHELLNEPDRAETIESILGWLNVRIPAKRISAAS